MLFTCTVYLTLRILNHVYELRKYPQQKLLDEEFYTKKGTQSLKCTWVAPESAVSEMLLREISNGSSHTCIYRKKRGVTQSKMSFFLQKRKKWQV